MKDLIAHKSANGNVRFIYLKFGKRAYTINMILWGIVIRILLDDRRNYFSLVVVPESELE